MAAHGVVVPPSTQCLAGGIVRLSIPSFFSRRRSLRRQFTFGRNGLNEKRPGPIARPGALSLFSLSAYSSIYSTSRTICFLSADRNDERTMNTASLKPPMFRMSFRSGTWMVP